MSQNPIGIGNDFGRGRIETGQRRLVTIPIAHPQHRDVQAGEGIRVDFLFVRVRRNPPGVKRRRSAEPFNRLKHPCRVDRRH